MKSKAISDASILERLALNPLVRRVQVILKRVEAFRQMAREYYYGVVLSRHSCPDCDGRLRMIGESECKCDCGRVLDPTLYFQRSVCCGVGLARKTFHYACVKCGKSTPSKFIFDERVFDAAYFKDAMHEHRQRARAELKCLAGALAALPAAPWKPWVRRSIRSQPTQYTASRPRSWM